MTILIVDDNETDRKVLRKILEREGIQTIEAEDGVEALTVLERERVEAVIADVIMPNMDGYQFCYELRQSLIHRRLPIILYSHFGNETMGQVAREFGADFFLKKPASPAQILESIRLAREAQSRQTTQSPLKLPESYGDRKTYSEWLIRKLEEQNDQLERSESRYRQLVELSPDGVLVVCEGEVLFINGAGAQILGAASPREIEGRQVMDFVHPEFRDAVLRRTADLLQGKVDRNPPFEQMLLRLHGGNVEVETMSASFTYINKPAVLVLVRDISSRKEAERRLRESERFLSTLVSNLPGIVYRCKVDVDWTMEYISEGVETLTGYSPDDFLSHRVTYNAIICPEDRQKVWDDIQRALGEDRPFQIVYRVKTKEGDVRWFWEQGRAVKGEKGEVAALEGFITDMTDRQQFAMALERSETNYRVLMEQSVDAILIADAQGYYIDANARACEMFGFSKEELLRKRIGDLRDPSEQSVLPYLLSLPVGQSWVSEVKFQRKDGSQLFIEVRGKKLPDGRIQGVYHDATKRKKAEEELRRSEVNYRTLMEQASDAILIADASGRYIEANNRALEYFGYTREEILLKHIGELSHPSGSDPLARFMALPIGETAVDERKCLRKDGTVRIAEAGGKKLSDGRIQIIFRDITERKRREEALSTQQAFIQRLADLLPSIVYVYDLIERKPFYANRAAGGILGYTPEALREMGPGFIAQVMHPEDAALYHERVKKFITAADGVVIENEYRLRNAQGGWLRFRCSEIIFNRDPDGRPRLILGIAHDITHQFR